MRVIDLSGKTHSWSLGKYIGRQRLNCSAIHEDARNFLTEKYPAAQILEEVYLPGEFLYLDFFIPIKMLAIECQGEQHDKHIAFFHKTKSDFFAAKANDRRKAEWCRINRIDIVYFYPKESATEWEQKLNR